MNIIILDTYPTLRDRRNYSHSTAIAHAMGHIMVVMASVQTDYIINTRTADG